MGMFDTLYDSVGIGWQTKALACSLDAFRIGDEIEGPPIDYQMEVIGGHDPINPERMSGWAFATIRAGRLVEAGVPRDMSLPVREYSSGWKRPGERSFNDPEPASVDAETAEEN